MVNNRKNLGDTGVGPPYEYKETVEDYLREGKSKKIEERAKETGTRKDEYKYVFSNEREIRKIVKTEAEDAIKDFTEKEEFKYKVNEIIQKTEDKLSDKIDDSKLKTIETLGIFVALFTFVSVEFQFFRTFDNWLSIVSFTFILLGSLLTFVTVINYYLSETKEKKEVNGKEEIKSKFWSLIIIWMFLMSIGILLFTLSSKKEVEKEENCKIENEGSTIETQGNIISLPKG